MDAATQAPPRSRDQRQWTVYRAHREFTTRGTNDIYKAGRSTPQACDDRRKGGEAPLRGKPPSELFAVQELRQPEGHTGPDVHEDQADEIEERRVGKECRSRWLSDELKENTVR